VHSAVWTPTMRAQIEDASQAQKAAMLRRYGWGVPDLGRAVMSTTNDATLMVEDALFPFPARRLHHQDAQHEPASLAMAT
jgi:hypothetical protein